VNAGGNMAFDDNGRPVAVTDFDFAAIDEAERAAERASYENKIAALEGKYKENLRQLIRFIFETFLDGNPPPKVVGERVYFLAFHSSQTSYTQQTQLAKRLNVTPSLVSQRLKSLEEKFPLKTGKS
jgi:hypothetical protein